jgi:hypothetical protein
MFLSFRRSGAGIGYRVRLGATFTPLDGRGRRFVDRTARKGKAEYQLMTVKQNLFSHSEIEFGPAPIGDDDVIDLLF